MNVFSVETPLADDDQIALVFANDQSALQDYCYMRNVVSLVTVYHNVPRQRIPPGYDSIAVVLEYYRQCGVRYSGTTIRECESIAIVGRICRPSLQIRPVLPK